MESFSKLRTSMLCCAPLVQVVGAWLCGCEPRCTTDETEDTHDAWWEAGDEVHPSAKRSKHQGARQGEVDPCEVLLYRPRSATGTASQRTSSRRFWETKEIIKVIRRAAVNKQPQVQQVSVQRGKLEQRVWVEARRAPSHPVDIVHLFELCTASNGKR